MLNGVPRREIYDNIKTVVDRISTDTHHYHIVETGNDSFRFRVR